MKSVTLPAYAKVNLYLDVLGKRPDGYHELVTLFERIDLADELTLEPIPGKEIEIRCDDPQIPRDRSNLAARAADSYRRALGISQGVRISLKKKIPVAAGLGGGSSDAAATLKGLQELNGNPLPQEELHRLAGGLGADVPFFLSPGPLALGRGRGDELHPLEVRPSLWHLLVFPSFPIPTKAVYQAYRLTAPGPDVTLLTRALRDNHVPGICDLLFNALEPTVEALYPALLSVKAALRRAGLARPIVSGSGSTVMALCASQKEASFAAGFLREQEPGWQLFVAGTRG
ncbi:MAG: 4-(cytidine 5'-diphospho)-2-C-methyl-D-erythritol kinase [Candidatus Omnitrophica bacterium]|nr:4-(cytidine 5'-diphospho)-2-C-methyl-D-erythritol kinase [Candidatus Omnitrophota bacterium]